MSSAAHYPHVEMNAQGQALIASTRYKILHLAAEHFHYGWTAEELLRQHPDLRPEEVYAALTYFYDHYEAMVNEFQQIPSASKLNIAPTADVSREELMQRRSLLSEHRGA